MSFRYVGQRFLSGGDFGESIRQQQPALALVLERVPASLALLAASARWLPT